MMLLLWGRRVVWIVGLQLLLWSPAGRLLLSAIILAPNLLFQLFEHDCSPTQIIEKVYAALSGLRWSVSIDDVDEAADNFKWRQIDLS